METTSKMPLQMTTKQLVKRAHALAEPFRVSRGKSFRLKDVDPGDTLDLTAEDKPRAKEALERWARTAFGRVSHVPISAIKQLALELQSSQASSEEEA